MRSTLNDNESNWFYTIVFGNQLYYSRTILIGAVSWSALQISAFYMLNPYPRNSYQSLEATFIFLLLYIVEVCFSVCSGCKVILWSCRIQQKGFQNIMLDIIRSNATSPTSIQNVRRLSSRRQKVVAFACLMPRSDRLAVNLFGETDLVFSLIFIMRTQCGKNTSLREGDHLCPSSSQRVTSN